MTMNTRAHALLYVCALFAIVSCELYENVDLYFFFSFRCCYLLLRIVCERVCVSVCMCMSANLLFFHHHNPSSQRSRILAHRVKEKKRYSILYQHFFIGITLILLPPRILYNFTQRWEKIRLDGI